MNQGCVFVANFLDRGCDVENDLSLSEVGSLVRTF